MTPAEREALIRSLTVLMAAYQPGAVPDPMDSDTYIYAYRAGARSAIADVICRLRDVQAESVATVTRIGGDVA